MEKKHIHETNPWRTAITLTFFVLIIIVGLITIRSPRLKYVLSPQQTVELASKNTAVFYPYDLESVINGKADTVVIIDIRDKFTFGREHIPGAENIAALTLLSDENIRKLNHLKNEGMTVVIYDDDQLSADGPWMVFQQLGFNNVRILLGGYKYYKAWKDRLGDTYSDKTYIKGYPEFDFAEVAKPSKSVSGKEQSEAKPVIIQRRKKSSAAEGGC